MFFTLAAALGLWLPVAWQYQRTAVKELGESLVLINADKAGDISEWFDAHRREAQRLSRHSFLGEIVSQEISKPGTRRAQLSSWIKDHALQKKYASMAFLSPAGAGIVATPGYKPGTEKEFIENFRQASQKDKPFLTDLYLAADGRPRLTMFSPISAGGRGGKTLCVLVMNIDPETELYPLVKASPIFNKRAETLLVRREADSVLYLNELNYYRNSALKLKRLISEESLPAAAALKGQSGFFEGTDYRGTRVFSAIGPVEGTTWALVTQLDRAVLLAEIRPRQLLAGALILLAALLFYSLARLFLLYREKAAMETLNRAQTALRVSEQIFREFMERSPVYVFFKDENIRAVHLSRNFETMLGKPLGELLGRRMDELFPSDLAKSMVADDQRILREGKEVTVEEEFNGRSYLTTKFPIALEGKPCWLAGFTVDITETRRAGQALKESEQRFRSLWLHMVEGVALHELVRGPSGQPSNYRIIEVNPAYGPALDLRPEDTVGKLATEVYGTPTAPYLAEFSAVAASGVPTLMETYFAPMDKYFSISIAPWGKDGFATIFSDITARKRSEHELRSSEALLREAQEIGQIGSYLLDIPSGLWTSSAALDAIFGIGAEYERSVAGWTALIHPDDRAMMANYFAGEVVGRGRPFDREYRTVRQSDGARRWVHGRGRLERDAQGRPVKMHGTIQDITERKLAEAAMENLNRALTSSKAELENFLYITTHDLRSPLVNIQGFSRNLECDIKALSEHLAAAALPPAAKAEVEKLTSDRIPGELLFVLEGARKMDALIANLLKVSRLGRVQMQPETVDMNALMVKILASLRFQTEEAGATITTGALPPCKADPAAVSQLFSNLLDNAVKYRHKDRALAVTVTGELSGGTVTYTVADNGSGIPEASLAGIWSIFSPSDKATGKKGEGIGLAMVRRLAEKNGGNIKVTSKEGEGTVFNVELPAGETPGRG